MSRRRLAILEEDDDDPMLSAVNLVDVFLVLVVALLVALSIRQQGQPDGESVTIIRNAGQPDMEITVRERGQEVRFKGTGEQGAAQGQRAGVAYRLPDGQIVYVPESASQPGGTDGGLKR